MPRPALPVRPRRPWRADRIADVALEVVNDGSIEVVAVAGAEGANGWAWATGVGISVTALSGTTSAPYYGVISGTIANRRDARGVRLG